MPEVSNVVPDGDKLGVGNVVLGGDGSAQRGPANGATGSGSSSLPQIGVREPVHDSAVGQEVDCEVSAAEIAAYDELKSVRHGSMATQNEFLQRLLTLNTALLGGGLVLAKGEVLPLWWAFGTMTLLFLSLTFCLLGLAPKKFLIPDFSMQSYCDYLNAREDTAYWKQLMTRLAGGSFAMALLIGVFGMGVKGLAERQKPTEVIIERTGKAIDQFEHVTDKGR